jgi:hypothetical protein
MSLTPDPDPTAVGGANTDRDDGHQPELNPPEQVDVRRWTYAVKELIGAFNGCR